MFFVKNGFVVKPLTRERGIVNMVTKENLVEIFDTTCRDGEQTKGVNFSTKLPIVQRLTEAGVDSIEIGSSLWGAPESDKEMENTQRIVDWAKHNECLDCIELLSWLDDRHIKEWVVPSGVQTVNLLCEASRRFAMGKLQQRTEGHIAVIRHMISEYAKHGIRVNLYFEDWSHGQLKSPEHLKKMLDAFSGDDEVNRIMLCDTMGLLNPDQVKDFILETFEQYPKGRFDFHAHNDRSLGVANTLAAVNAGIRRVHVTVNGLGERTGNVSLDEAIANLHYEGYRTNVNELMMYKLRILIEAFSRQRCAPNKAVTGRNATIHVAGVHQRHAEIYQLVFQPERFGVNIDDDAIGKLTGKSAIKSVLRKLNLPVELTEDQEKDLRKRASDLEKHKTVTRGDFLYMLADVLGQPEIKSFEVKSVSLFKPNQQKPTAVVTVVYKGKELEVRGSGDGKYDAFMKALRKAANRLKFNIPALVDYDPHIPPGGDASSPVEAIITWEYDNETFITSGLDTDQDMAAIEATEKAINLCNNGNHANQSREPKKATF